MHQKLIDSSLVQAVESGGKETNHSSVPGGALWRKVAGGLDDFSTEKKVLIDSQRKGKERGGSSGKSWSGEGGWFPSKTEIGKTQKLKGRRVIGRE